MRVCICDLDVSVVGDVDVPRGTFGDADAGVVGVCAGAGCGCGCYNCNHVR